MIAYQDNLIEICERDGKRFIVFSFEKLLRHSDRQYIPLQHSISTAEPPELRRTHQNQETGLRLCSQASIPSTPAELLHTYLADLRDFLVETL
jgi:hypothetical protein